MSTQVKLRRGTALEHETFTGALAELTVDTTNNKLRLHDGVTPGGNTMMPYKEGVVQVATIADLLTLTPTFTDQIVSVSSGGTYKWSGSEWVSVTSQKYVNPSMSQSQIQQQLDGLSEGDTLVFLPGDYSGLVKDTSLTGFPHNDQPCLLLRGKNNITIHAKGAVLSTSVHAQGIFEIQQCTGVDIHNMKVIGAGNFPPLDGTTGRGEKGVSGGGYHTSGFWGYYKNNSYDSSADNRGGFGGSFPQWDGGTASTWGAWNGGFIGNTSYGILIHNACKNIRLYACDASGFNYVGIGVGHNGDYHPSDLSYPDSSNIYLLNCIGTNNYSAGINAMAVSGFTVEGGDTSENGHPDASPITDAAVDPGYGTIMRGSAFSAAKNCFVSGMIAKNNVRKGIDSHAGEDVIISGNITENNAICGIYMSWSGTSQPTRGYIISGNISKNDSYAGSNGHGAIYCGGHGGGSTTGDAIISDNLILNPGKIGIWVRYLSHCSVTNNRIRGSNGGGTHILGESESGFTEQDIIVSNNSIFDDAGGFSRGIQFSRISSGMVSSNKVTITNDNSNIGVYAVDCGDVDFIGNSARLGSLGTPIVIGQTTGNCFGNRGTGGALPSISGPIQGNRSQKAIAETITFSLAFNGTTSPVLTKISGPDNVVSAAEITQGVAVYFEGLSEYSTLSADYEMLSSNGLSIGGGSVNPYFYMRGLGHQVLELGIKQTPASSHTPASGITAGIIRITLTVI